MFNGIPADRIFLIIGGKCKKSGAVEQGDGCVRGTNKTGSYHIWNVRDPDGGKVRVVDSPCSNCRY